MVTGNHFSPEYLPEGYMDDLRYVIEVRDECGWIDNAEFDDLAEARREAAALKPSFNGNVKIIDRLNQIEVT